MSFRLKHLLPAVALLGTLGSAQAVAVASAFDPDCPGFSNNVGRSSVVLSQVTSGSPNTYQFKVCNTSNSGEGEGQFILRDWEMPYDPLAGITGLVAPAGWGVTIEIIGEANANTGWDGETPTWFNPLDDFYDPRYLGLTQVIHFYTCAPSPTTERRTCDGDESQNDLDGPLLFPGDGLAGFAFQSPFGATGAPYQASWVQIPPRSGDPDYPTPGGPNSPGLRSPVPEPAV